VTNYYSPINDGQVWPVSKPLSESNLSKVEAGNTLMDNVLAATHQGAFGGCILKNSNGRFGARINPGTGLNVTVSPFTAIIGDKLHELKSDITVPTTPRKAGLLYAQKQPLIGNLVPSFGVKNAIYHSGNGHTINRYTFSEEGNPQDTGSDANPITAMVDCDRVDGHVDYARKGNGSTSYMATAGAAGVTGAYARTELILYTPHNLSGSTVRYIKIYGNYHLYTEGTRLKVREQANIHDTGYDCQLNKITYIAVRYDGATLTVFAGIGPITPVYSVTAVFNTTSGNLHFLRNSTATNYNAATMHFYELLNYAMTDAEIYQAANGFIIPCRYEGAGENIIPAMTSNNTPAGIASASANNPDAYKAFDGDDGTVWAMAGASGQLNYEHAVPKKVFAYGIKCVGGATNPKNWTFQALSADETTWITLDTQTNVKWSADGELIFYIPDLTLTGGVLYSPGPNYYKSYRINITANNGGATTEIIQFNMYDELTERSIVDDILPVDSISLGFVLSGSTEIEEIDDKSYKYGRIEYGNNGEKGNKRIFSGWFAVSVGGVYNITNVLGTEKIVPFKIMYKKWVSDSATSYCEIYSSTLYVVVKSITQSNIQIVVGSGNVVFSEWNYTGATQSNGYLGFWMEVAE
jgi:hypothetical protein